ncbi:hypothetical protein MRB53_020451 [Persea americana]|uniref:Uncharacterized protein n=1 Tax=Persea americana TaxID=3435 RepID=A0ACC2L102_PERAE|nr:hypothetical protein MRB53_020451 [Persea americana]
MEMQERWRWEVIYAWAVMEGVRWMGQRDGEGSSGVRSAPMEGCTKDEREEDGGSSGIYFMTQPRPVYLVDFALHKGRDDQKCPHELFMERSRLTGFFNERTMTFQKKILERSGLGQLTYLPDALFNIPALNPCMAEARKEVEAVVFGAVDQVLAKTGVKPKDIGILVVNSSFLNPIPSLSAMIVNHYKLRSNIKSFNLGGMGYSAGVISVDLAKKLHQVGYVFVRYLGYGV